MSIIQGKLPLGSPSHMDIWVLCFPGQLSQIPRGVTLPHDSAFRVACVESDQLKSVKGTRKRKENATVPIIPFIPISFEGCVINSYWRGVTE